MNLSSRTIQTLSIALFLTALVWGVYATLYYIGVPVHSEVLMTPEGKNAVSEVCTGNVCRGISGIFSVISMLLKRLSPFTTYIVLSILAYGGALVVAGVRTGKFSLSFTLRPWHVYAGFAAAFTLLFLTLTYGSTPLGTSSGVQMVPARSIVEPTSSVYTSMSSDSLATLQKNYNELEARGCLTVIGSFGSKANLANMSTRCILQSFATRVLTQFAFISVLLLLFASFGRLLLRTAVRLQPNDALVELVVSAILGACGTIVVLWLLAVFGILIKPVGWAAFAIIAALSWRDIWHWLREMRFAGTQVHVSWNSARALLLWALVSYVALNFLTVIRPFPIGWDDLGSYLNRPRLLVSYGSAIHTMATLQWEYNSAIGFLLFGYESVFGATASMMVNWSAGVLAIFSIGVFARSFLGKGAGLLSAILYYFLPLVGHFSFADMKIDNAIFAMGAASMLCTFYYLFKNEGSQGKHDWKWVALAGFFGGFAFGMKQTAIMVAMANLVLILGALVHWSAFIGGVVVALGVFANKGAISIDTISQRIGGLFSGLTTSMVLSAFVVIALLAFGITLRVAKKQFLKGVVGCSIFIGAFLLAMSPWLVRNNYLVGNAVPGLEFGAPDTLSPRLDFYGSANPGPNVHTLPPDLRPDANNPACTPTGNKEELDRYWGFSHGISHYLTLPWRSVNNLDSAGYYVTTMPALLLFPLILLLPYFWSAQGRWLRWLFLGTLFIVLEWMFTANGIPWYGVGMFLGLCIGLEVLVQRAPDPLGRIALSTVLTLSVCTMLSNRLWQYDQQQNLLSYAMGKSNNDVLMAQTVPYYDDVAAMVKERNRTMADRPFLYRVGTFIPYFIPRNLEVIGMVDHQLDVFNCLYQERDPALTTKRLKALGFNSIIFDTNTATIERDANGSLHKKVNAFVNYLNNPASGITPVINSPEAGLAYVLIP